MPLICCAGVGGTGKTITVNAMMALRSGLFFIPSIVRRYYQLRGVESETSYLALPLDGRLKFEVGLIEYYIEDLSKRMADRPNRIFVADRSIFDHLAYAIYADPEMTLGHLNEVLSFAPRFLHFDPMVFYFPYPTKWTAGNAAADGFRDMGIGKNWAINAMMLHLLRTSGLGDFVSVPHGTPSDRARFILEEAGILL